MSTEDRDEGSGLDKRTDQALWTLLGRQKPPQPVSPYFARRVLREVGLAEEDRATGWAAWARRWFPSNLANRRLAVWSGVLSGVCALALVCLTQLPQIRSQARSSGARVSQDHAESVVAQSTPEMALSEPGETGDDTATIEDSSPV